MLALLLQRRDVREFDQIISCYSRERGRVAILARGVKKITSKNSPSLEPGTVARLETVPGKEMDLLTTAESVELFSAVRSDGEKLAMNTFCIHLLDSLLLKHQPDEHIFDTAVSWMDFLNTSVPASEALVYSLILKILVGLGFAPVLDNCVYCRQPIDSPEGWFSIEQGGLAHAHCRESLGNYHRLATFERGTLETLLRADWAAAGACQMSAPLMDSIDHFLFFHSEKKLPRWSEIQTFFPNSGAPCS